MTTSLYYPYKAVGYVTDRNPFCINRLGDETFLTVSIGKSFQVYRFDKLTVCLVSRAAPGTISCLQALGHETFCAVGSDIVVFDRTQIQRMYKAHSAPIIGMIVIGKNVISYDEANNIKVIDTKLRTVVSEMKSLQPSKIVSITHPATYVNKIVVGYANGQLELWNIQKKTIVYTFAAHLELLARGTAADSFADPFADEDEEEKQQIVFSMPAVSSIEQSPACDVVGVGFASGDVVLINLKLDRVLFSFKQDGGAVTSISFRSDSASDRFPFMVSSSSDGRLHVWNLGSSSGDGAVKLERKLQNSIDEAHSSRISRVHFLYGEPMMVSAGEDNSIKVWIFDSPDGTARLLRSREGHSGCPLKIRYYGGSTNASMRDNADATSCEIISAGSDGTLRLFNTAVESQNREMSQQVILKKLGLRRRHEKLPVTIGFDFSEARQRDWANLATIHKNHSNTYLWKFKNRAVTEMILRQPGWTNNEMMYSTDRNTHSTAVVISPCGNYCAVGSRGGRIHLYNIQSGLPRGAFPVSRFDQMKAGQLMQKQAVPGNVFHEQKKFMSEGTGAYAGSLNPVKRDEEDPETEKEREAALRASLAGHTQDVTGMFIEIANTVMVTCGLDGLLIFWDFGSHAILQKVPHSSPLSMMIGFQDGGFVAVASQDRVVRVYDISTYKISRRFAGHSREISDLAFSSDGRRLLSSSLDGTMRVWDMPTGRCLSWLSFDAPVLSMAMSHSGEFLSLTQAGKEGIFMYVDRSLYETVHFWKEPTAPVSVQDSMTLADQPSKLLSGGEEDDQKEEENMEMDILPTQAQVETGAGKESKGQRGAGLITMAAVARAYWTSLFNLEAIKARNRATAAPVAAVKAPFFLPTVVRGGSTPSFPTPAEFEQLMKKTTAGSAEPSSSLKRKGEQDTADSKKMKESNGIEKEEDEATVLAQLATMGSAWGDEGEDSWGTGPAAVERTVDVTVNKTEVNSVSFEMDRRPMSRIINRKTALPRCKLVVFLLKEYPEGAPTEEDSAAEVAGGDEEEDGPILGYLKSLPPPAVDLEFRALCTHEEDEEGLGLLRCFLFWTASKLATGTNFEILQAYLHRLLSVYAELILKQPALFRELEKVRAVHALSSNRFRHLVQSNLCLLKMLAGLPPT